MITTRRATLAGLAGSLLPRRAGASLPVPASGRLAFLVSRNGSRMGSHTLAFASEADRLTVTIAVDLAVHFGPIPLFRYRHRATELWQADRFISLVAETDDNGTAHRVEIAREPDDTLRVTTLNARRIAPAEALAATHWNRAMLDGPLINTQKGEVERYRVQPLGRVEIQDAAGRPLAADAFTLSAEISFTTWYDPFGWAGLGFKGEDGSEITYRRE